MCEELWTEVHDIVQEVVIKNIPKKKKCKKAKWLSEEALHIAGKRREAKGKGEKERYTQKNLRDHYTNEETRVRIQKLTHDTPRYHVEKTHMDAQFSWD